MEKIIKESIVLENALVGEYNTPFVLDPSPAYFTVQLPEDKVSDIVGRIEDCASDYEAMVSVTECGLDEDDGTTVGDTLMITDLSGEFQDFVDTIENQSATIFCDLVLTDCMDEEMIVLNVKRIDAQ